MIFDFSDKINVKGLKIIFSNDELDSHFIKRDVFSMLQTHSTNLKVVNEKKVDYNNTDGIFSTKKFNVWKIKTADWLPIFFFHKKHNSFGVVHAGWKGLKDGIIEESINLINNHVDNIIDIEVLIGPSISKKNYEVQKEFIDYFGSEFIDEIDNKLFCDLKGIAKSKLKTFGLKNIIDTNQCTYENKNFHSFRRDRTSKRMIGLIYYEWID